MRLEHLEQSCWFDLLFQSAIAAPALLCQTITEFSTKAEFPFGYFF
jgi:hypothetical protein